MLSDTGEVGLLLGNQFLVGARNGRKSLTGAPGAEGRVLQWSCHKWSSKGRGSAPEDGTKASERSFSGANWL